MRTDVDVLRELLVECDQEAVGCDAKAQWLWAQDLDREAEDMIQVGAMHQARARAIAAALELLAPERVEARPVEATETTGPSLRSTLKLHVNPEKIA